MADTVAIVKVKRMTEVTDDELIGQVLDDAEDFVLGYTGRSFVPCGLERTVRDLAVIALNRMGTEGESGRSEAGESYSFEEAPRHIYDMLDHFRLARVGGKVHEYKPKDATDQS